MKFLSVVFSMAFISSAFAWPRFNNPFSFDRNLNTRFDELPSKAKIAQTYIAWPGSHWSNHLGGIAHRWSANNPQNFTYKKLTKEELLKLPQRKIDELSPAEKYDILMQRYDYPTVAKEFRENSPSDITWNGICHGVAPASLNHPEPLNKTIVSPDGIRLNFYSSDLKALLSYQYAKIWRPITRHIGKRCNAPERSRAVGREQQQACNDLDAGAFHLLFTNYIGLKNKTFIVDIDPLIEVWNHIPTSYSYDIYEEYETREDATPGTAKVLWIGAALNYAGAIAPFFEPVIDRPQGYFVENNYSYLLDLDKWGNIIGGKWLSDLRPDFIWTQKPVKFKGYWWKLNQIYTPRTSDQF